MRRQPLPPCESQPLANRTHLQADLGGVQGEGEEVSKTGRCARPQELHNRCGRHLGWLKSNHGPGGWAWFLLRSRERGCLAVLCLCSGRKLQEVDQGNGWSLSCLALSYFQGPTVLLKQLYKVRSLGTVTLNLPAFGLYTQVISHLSHVTVPVTSVQGVEAGSS